MKSLFILFLIAIAASLSGNVSAQPKPPRSDAYPVRKNDFYRGPPDAVVLAWLLNSRLLALRGRPDWKGSEGVYLYSLTNNRFRLVYHVDLITWNKMRADLR